ncbi:MAG TPA: hypothetical protein VHF50_08145 [Solirubrobacterales bacterium]|nr:hypothetical protein [Solirubrobacterales bacterium]
MARGRDMRVRVGAGRVGSAIAVVFVALLVLASAARADVASHPFLETFGSAAEPTLNRPAGMAVDQSSGDLLVIDMEATPGAEAGALYRFNADGTPAPFSALGSNVIDGAGGADETPQGQTLRHAGSPSEVAVAADNSGTVTDGNIYVSSAISGVVHVFSSSGAYLGQLSESSEGPFGESLGVAVDPDGNVYVTDFNGKVHKFDPAAQLPVTADNVANFDFNAPAQIAAGEGAIFVAEYMGFGGSGKVFKLDSTTGDVEYQVGSSEENMTLTVDPATGHLFTASAEEVVEYHVGADEATPVSTISAGSTVQGVAVDGDSGNVYVTRAGVQTVEVFGPLTYGSPPQVVTKPATSVTGTAGTLNGTVDPEGAEVEECFFRYGTTPAYGQTVPCVESSQIGEGDDPVAVHADLSGLTTGTAYHFQLVAKNAVGTAQGGNATFETLAPPAIAEQHVVAVTSTEATVAAKINPRGTPTTYRVEYGADDTYGETTDPVSLGSGTTLQAVTVSLKGLASNTTYHWRFVATNDIGTTNGSDKTFRTFGALKEKTNCPNQIFRSGASARLPDCRAYEMVSPIDKEGGEIAVQDNINNAPAGLDQASTDGEKLTYSSYRAFGDPESAPFTSQYIATRGATGWASQHISAPIEGRSPLNGRRDLDNQYKLFSADLCVGWMAHFTDPPLDSSAPAGYANLYKRQNCGGIGYEALVNSTPELATAANFLPELQGTSDDGSCAVFRARGKLTPDASTKTEGSGEAILQVYETCGEQTRLISVLPDGTPSERHSTAGTLGRNADHDNSVWHAVSSDGSRVYWSVPDAIASPTPPTAPLYVRDNTDQPQSAVVGGVCTEPEKACTYRVSPASPSGPVVFWGANPAGSKALYSVGKELFEYDFDAKSSTPIASGAEGVIGHSTDLARIYLVSTQKLSGEEENSVGRKAEAGKPNVYLREAGTFRYVATLSSPDVSPSRPTSLAPQPGQHLARVTPDGEVAAFTAVASLTGYDNTDANSGEADAEIYLYDSTADGGEGSLVCISCEPSGARPVGRNAESLGTLPNLSFWAAAYVSPWPTQLRASNVLSEDGSRLFFESFGPLVSRDDNDARDVYEWQRAASQLECEEAGAEHFVPSADGCLSLISSGAGEEDSEFVDATPDGSDVFIKTFDSLVPHDPGFADIYDAREDGGLLPPPPPPADCSGPACQGTDGPPPAHQTPASTAPSGGNVEKRPNACGKRQVRRKGRCVARRCGKRQVRRKGRCVARKQARKRASDKRRAGR